MSSTGELTAKAKFLRNASPRAFDEFCDAFENYTEAAAATLIMATENWQLYQGQAQQCIKIMKALEEARHD